MKLRTRSWFLILFLLLIALAVWVTDRRDGSVEAPYDLDRVLAELKPLDLSTPIEPTAATADYFSFHGLNPTNAAHYFGRVEAEGSTLAAHVFIPTNATGTLFLVHGFLDHSGTLSKLIQEGLNRRFAVVTWDLPGHGLSSGARTDTGAFEVCARQLADLIERTGGRLPRPYQLICHSTGCSIAIEYLRRAEEISFDRIVFLAPLVRHTQWGWAKFGHTIADPFSDGVKRKIRANSSDEAYLAFARADPLVHDSVSFAYLDALYAWEKRARAYPPRDEAIVIIQGEDDEVVDWKHNLARLKTIFPNAKIHTLPGARHQLANESEEHRAQVFKLVFTGEE